MLETTARSAHCQRCTNCSRQYCTADYIHDSTKNQRKIRRDSEAHTRQQIILRRTEWLSRNATSEESKCGQRQSTSRRHSTPSHTNQFGTPSFQHGSTEFTERSHSAQAKEERNDHDCLTNLRFADDVLLFAGSKNVVRIQEKYWKSGSQDPPRKDESSQQPKQPLLGNEKKMQIDDIKNWNPDKKWKHGILGPNDYIPATGNDRNQESYQGSLGDVSQVQAGTDIEKLFAQTPRPTVRRSDNSDDVLRIGNMGTHKEHERKMQSTQRKMLRLIIQTKRIYKKIVKQKDKTNEEKDTNDLSSTGRGRLDRIHKKRSTNDAIERMGNVKIRCWNKTHKRMKWRLALRIATSPSERWLMKAAEWKPELSSKYRTNRAIGRPRKRWEDDINGFLKQVEDRKQQPNQQNMDQQSKRPRKMNFTRRKYTNTSEEQENNARLKMRRNNQSRPARYVNRVRLSDEDVANIT